MQSEALLSTTLGAICEQQGGTIQTGPFGSQLHASDYAASGTPVVMPADIVGGRVSTAAIARVGIEHVERLSQHQLRFNDIVFSRRGDVTRFARVTAREVGWLCGTGCIKVRTGTGTIALPEWISIALAAPEVKDWLVRHAVGATMPNLNTSILGAVPLRVPPIEQQREAVEVCFALDDRIDLLRQTNATLESIAQALFKSWFIDFDPVRAKADGREPEGMDAATAALFPAEFEESALGLIPKGWSAGSLANLSMLNAASWTRRRAPAEVTYVDLAGVKSNVFDPPQRYRFADAPSRARRSLRAGDTLVGTVRPGNRSFGFIAEAEPGLTGSTGFAVLSPTTSFGAAFVYLSATRDENIDRLAALADGGAYPAVRPELVHSTPCVVPSEVVLRAFHSVASPLLVSIAANTQRGRTLGELRDTLLPRLISGKLRLPEAEAAVEAVA